MAEASAYRNGAKAVSSQPTNGGFLRRTLDRMSILIGRRPTEASLRESIEDVLETHVDGKTTLTDEEQLMLRRILGVGELRVEDVMVPRADIVAVDVATTLPDLMKMFSTAAHSRLPIYRETLDDPIGMVHIKDLVGALIDLPADSTANGYVLNKLRRDVLFVPPSMPVLDLLLKMQRSRIHLALVIDEYGGTDGLVSIEDLVEQIVGEIEDEHDTEEAPHLVPRSDGGFNADARVLIQELEDALKMDLLPEDREEDIDTLGGLLFSLVGRVPQRGELIEHSDTLEFEIVDADPRRIKKVRVHVGKPVKRNKKNDSHSRDTVPKTPELPGE